MRSTGTRFIPENSPINDYSNCWSERQSEDRLLTASAGESSLGLIDVSTRKYILHKKFFFLLHTILHYLFAYFNMKQ